jgi:hypothetical protein
MTKRILLGCYEIPGFGGANTSTYELFERLQNDGLDVYYLNLIDARDLDYFRYFFGADFGNPNYLRNVYNCVFHGPLSRRDCELTKLIRELKPNVMVGGDYIAALLLKKAGPEINMIFTTSGCMQVQQLIKKRVIPNALEFTELIDQEKASESILNDQEKEAVKASDLVITHSDMIKSFYDHIYATYTGKIYPDVIWRAEWIRESALDFVHSCKPFAEREIDLLFVSSSWNRPEKNYKLVRNVVPRLKGLNVQVVGEADRKMENAAYHGIIAERKDLFALMGNSKSIASPSVFDSAPGILFEGATLGCNVIASKNCGNWQLCNDNLLVVPFDDSTFIEKIFLASTRRFEANMGFFLEKNCYQNLVETIVEF